MNNSLQEQPTPVIPEPGEKVNEKKDGNLDPTPEEKLPVRDPVITPVIPQKLQK